MLLYLDNYSGFQVKGMIAWEQNSKPIKNPYGFKQNHKKIPGSEINPQKITCSISEPQNFPKSINWYNKNPCHLKSRGPPPPPPPPPPLRQLKSMEKLIPKGFVTLSFTAKKLQTNNLWSSLCLAISAYFVDTVFSLVSSGFTCTMQLMMRSIGR